MLPKKPWLAPTALGLTTSAPHRPTSLQPGQKGGKLGVGSGLISSRCVHVMQATMPSRQHLQPYWHVKASSAIILAGAPLNMPCYPKKALTKAQTSSRLWYRIWAHSCANTT